MDSIKLCHVEKKGKDGSEYTKACKYVLREEKLTQEDSKKKETDILKNMPDRETVCGIYRTIRLSTKIYVEKPTECFKVKALYPGYNYLQNTFSIY